MESQEQKALAKEFNNEKLLPVLKNVAEKLDANKAPEKTELKQRSEADKKANEWISQFDKHFDKKPYSNNGMRFIKRYGKVMGVAEFLDYKFSQFNGFKHMKNK